MGKLVILKGVETRKKSKWVHNSFHLGGQHVGKLAR